MNEAASGRPVRFFILVMAGWVTIRLASPGGDVMDGPMEAGRQAAHPPVRPKIWAASTRSDGLLDWQAVAQQKSEPEPIPYRHDARPNLASRSSSKAIGTISAFIPAASDIGPARTTFVQQKGAEVTATINPAPAIPLASRRSDSADRWHGSFWVLWRDGSATRADAVQGGRLGGSQAGIRLDFDLTPQATGRTTAYARASTAMNRPASPEAALGLAWQPARTIPISFAAERRIALGKGGRDANAVMAVGGFGPLPVAPSLEVEAYAQGGMVGFRSNDFFVDGKMSLLSPIKHSPLRLGASLSGGAQPQVERLDIGPELQIRLPLKPAAARLSIEWRERIAGRAAPASGLAVTLGADF